MRNYNLCDIICFQRAKLFIKTAGIKCDLWDCINKGQGLYIGNYLLAYNWSMETPSMLDILQEKAHAITAEAAATKKYVK